MCLPDRYDDGGFTGGNMDRPALQRLLADIEAGKVDCIVVYKVDRFSRSLIDFAKIMDVPERHSVSFVSVTQQFNTSTSMGRLMLNVLLSFAQFEREIISERTRDKIAAARRRGRLMALAIRMQRLIESGEVRDYAEFARLGHVSRARVSQIMNLLCLAPDIQEDILFLPPVESGRDPIRELQLRPITLVPD